jgi:hypothetical protein
MSDYSIPLDQQASEMLNRIKDLPGAMRACAKVMDRQNQHTVSRIQSAYLSFSKSGPTQSIGCRVITNRLRGSIRAI